MIHGWTRVVLGSVALLAGIAGIWLLLTLGGSRTVYAMVAAAPLGVVMIVWGLVEATFKLGYGLFGESMLDVHPMGMMADSMLFVATADGKLTDAETRAILHILNDVHDSAIAEKRLKQRSRAFIGRKKREVFNQRIASAYTLDDRILHDIALGLVEVLRSEGRRPDAKTAIAASSVMIAVRAPPATAGLVSDVLDGGLH